MPPIPKPMSPTPIGMPPTIEELISMKRKARQITPAQLLSPLTVEFTSIHPTEVPMWKEAIQRSDKAAKYVRLIETDGRWVAMWNTNKFPRSDG